MAFGNTLRNVATIDATPVEKQVQTLELKLEQIELAALLRQCAETVCLRYRVPAEVVFSQPRDRLFVVRLAGNVLAEEGLGQDLESWPAY